MHDLKLPALGLCLIAIASACSNEVTVETGSGGSPGAGGSQGNTTSKSSSKASSTHAVTSTTTTGGAGGIGPPSNVYPAPHDPVPTVVSLGGTVLGAPNVVPIFFQGYDANLKAAATAFMGSVGATNYWHTATSEYGVGALTTSAPITLNETPASLIDDSTIQSWLGGKLNANDPTLPAPNGNRIYTVFYPQSTTISSDDGQGGKSYSCQSFGGYHSSFTLDAAHGNQKIAYAVMPYCGHFGPLQGLDALTGPLSHELIEASTDPDPITLPAFAETDTDDIAWTFALGGEVGDMCAQTPGAFTNFPGFDNAAQRTWSNSSALAGHDPCVPVPDGEVYFNAVPKMTDVIDLGGGFTFKGASIPVGGTRTIDVNLFSEGPTDPFSVQAYDAASLQGGAANLDLSFDEDTGQNGQTLHLTINVLAQGPYNFETFYLFSTLNNTTTIWVGAVGN
jgi:hypothetical protein